MSRIYNAPTVTKGKVTSSSASHTAAGPTPSSNAGITRGTSVTVTSASNGSDGLMRQTSADPLRLIKADTNPLSVRAQQTLSMLKSQNEWQKENRKSVAMGSYREPDDNGWQQVGYTSAGEGCCLQLIYVSRQILRPHSTWRSAELLRNLINSLRLNK